MATTQLQIKNSIIDTTAAPRNRYFEEVSPDGLYFRGNGWEVKLQNGKIICHSERRYSNGIAKCHREFPLRDGVVGLSGGNVKQRYAYFRDVEFVQFLQNYRITTMKRADPDGVYSAPQGHVAGHDIVSHLYADGKVESRYRPFCCAGYEGETEWTVSGATWVVLDKGGHKTLITKRPISEMRGILPNFTVLEESANRVYNTLKAATSDGPRPLGELIKLIPEEWAPHNSWECGTGLLVRPVPPYVDEEAAYLGGESGETFFTFTDEGGWNRPEYQATQPRASIGNN